MRSNQQRVTLLGLGLVLVTAALFRLYRLDDVLHWRGDEGRDASIMRSMIVTHRPVLIGPPTSVTTDAGSLYLGPATYYLMGVGLWLMQGDPIGPAVVVVFCSVLTVWMLWWVGRAWFGSTAGWFAAAIFAFTPNAILYGRHAWNPNVMPFFALLTIWAIWRAWTQQRPWWWLVAAGVFALTIQSHAFGWVVLPILLGCWVITARQTVERSARRKFWRASLFAVCVGFICVSPLILYDATYHGHTWKVLAAYRSNQAGQGFDSFRMIVDRLFHQARLTFEDIVRGSTVWRTWVALGLLAFSAIAFHRRPTTNERRGLILLGGWLSCGLAGLTLFRGPIFQQYREVLWPAVVLVLAWFSSRLLLPWAQWKFLPAVGVTTAAVFVLVKLIVNPTTESPSYDYRSTLIASTLIRTTSEAQPFALTMVSARKNSDAAYRYSVAWKYRPPSPEKDVQQLYVVCEETSCDLESIRGQLPGEWEAATLTQAWRLSSTVVLSRLTREP